MKSHPASWFEIWGMGGQGRTHFSGRTSGPIEPQLCQVYYVLLFILVQKSLDLVVYLLSYGHFCVRHSVKHTKHKTSRDSVSPQLPCVEKLLTHYVATFSCIPSKVCNTKMSISKQISNQIK